uniref:Uncharacterized protein n=1 Tax=Hyaloperonospora arabidopsidis (strain Emoy2) TaxID=559515 RepID=M4C447_HYAAE
MAPARERAIGRIFTAILCSISPPSIGPAKGLCDFLTLASHEADNCAQTWSSLRCCISVVSVQELAI